MNKISFRKGPKIVFLHNGCEFNVNSRGTVLFQSFHNLDGKFVIIGK